MSYKHVLELKKARKRIKNLEDRYICDALRMRYGDKSYVYGSPWNKEAKEIKDEINIAISNVFSIVDWLNLQGFKTGDNYSSEMREYRIAWIDNMIEYWKDKK